MEPASARLEAFLKPRRVRGGLASHTQFGERNGSYLVTEMDEPELLRLYARHLCDGGSNAGLMERHTGLSPLLFDFDFKYAASSAPSMLSAHMPSSHAIGPVAALPARRHGRSHVERIVRRLREALSRLVVLPPGGLRVYVMERQSPAEAGEGKVKDGLHLVVPDVVVHSAIQMHLRRELLPQLAPVFSDLGCINRPEDVYDESVLSRNGWFLYGSGKPGVVPYNVTGVCHIDHGGDTVAWEPRAAPDNAEDVAGMVRLLSIRNKKMASPLMPDAIPILRDAERVDVEARRHLCDFPDLFSPPGQDRTPPGGLGGRTASQEDYEMASRLIAILSPERAHGRADWISVGFAAHNIDNRLLTDWVAFSQQSPKFLTGVCEQLWSSLGYRETGFNLSSLRRWARADSPTEYAAIVDVDVSSRVRTAITGTHHDVAQVVACMFSRRYACCSVRNNQWYEYRGHRWVPCDAGHSLRKRLSDEVYKRFVRESSEVGSRIQSARGPDLDRLSGFRDGLDNVARRLKDSKFKDNVLKECRELMVKDGFESRLDSNPALIGFENGVYDLDRHTFRDGLPEDEISFSTGIDYVEYDPECPVASEWLATFLRRIQPDESVRDYLVRFLASGLHGVIKTELFHFFTGSGSNGKSVLINLLERALGDYAAKLPVSLLTQRRAASNAANSEVARLKGRRFAIMQEPSEREVLNVGLMKELTGGDRIQARALYREPFEFQPMMKLVLICNNLPDVHSDDNGTWRRVRVIEYSSSFVENPDPAIENQFKVNEEMRVEVLHGDPAYAAHFMAYLIHVHKGGMPNPPPEKVLAFTSRYRENNDVVELFVKHHLVEDSSSSVRADTIHQCFRDFVKGCAFTTPLSKRREVIAGVLRHTKNTRLIGQGIATCIQGIRMMEEDFSAEPAAG
jgi:P4 family phage/plasmid primase-like protien